MSPAWDIVRQGRCWLEEGECPHAVLEEVAEKLKGADDQAERAAWLLVSAEASLAACLVDPSLEAAAEAAAVFKAAREKECEAAAMSVLLELHLAKQHWEDAIATASAAAEMSKQLQDTKGQATNWLKMARAQLMQMRDPYEAARVALSAAQLFSEVDDKSGSAEALQLAAEAQLLYDPEQALKVAKEAVAGSGNAGDFRGQAAAHQVVTAAKTHIATIQRADQATSMAARGDDYAKHKWPRYAQQRGEKPMDPFATGEYMGIAQPLPAEKKKLSEKHNFSRKNFKWNDGRHATDGAWYRQELRFLPPAPEQE